MLAFFAIAGFLGLRAEPLHPAIRIRPAIEIETTGSLADSDLEIPDAAGGWHRLSPHDRDGDRGFWIVAGAASGAIDIPARLRLQRAIDGNPTGNLLVIPVAEGTHRVRVEIRNPVDDTWEIHTLAHLDGKAGRFRFAIPEGTTLDRIRISLHEEPLLSFPFHRGETGFGERILADPATDPRLAGPVSDITDGSAEFADDGSADAVAESDIWAVRGDSLYFFNQARGLQAIDLADLTEPRLTAQLRLPASGEQLYLIGANHLALLVSRGWNRDSELILADHDSAGGFRTRSVPVPGRIQESRLVGDRLYAVSQTWGYRYDDRNGSWINDSQVHVTEVDLSDPDNPEVSARLDLDAYQPIITATNDTLLVASRSRDNYYQTTVSVIDIRADRGEPSLSVTAELPVAGSIKDKFKLNIRNGVIATISEARAQTTGFRTVTTLETWDITALPLPDPGDASSTDADGSRPAPQPLGRLDLGAGERLFATRFVEDRAYIVTFLQIDPLWIIDLSDPENPAITAELEVPGWSTYLEFQEGRLLAVGVEDRRVTVSLFDVRDPTAPALLDRVALGAEGSYSWSEANYDEKAVRVLWQDGLVLVPYQSWDDGQWDTRVQLVELSSNGESLSLAGTIDHPFPPRRSTLIRDHVASISSTELLVTDVSDRAHPAVIAELALSWRVDRVIPYDGHLIQVESGSSWSGSSAWLRLSSTDAPDTIIGQLDLGAVEVIGHDLVPPGPLYLLTRRQSTLPQVDEPDGADSTTGAVTVFEVILHAIDVSEPAHPASISETVLARSDFDEIGWTTMAARRLHGGTTLLWHDEGSPYGIYPLAEDIRFGGDIWIPWNPRMRFWAVDVSDPAAPAILSRLAIEPTHVQRFSPVFVSGGRVLVAYETWRWQVDRGIGGTFLQEIDYAEPSAPRVREPVGLPGFLEGIHRPETDDALVLFTSASFSERDPEDRVVRWGQLLQASVYDGVRIYLADEVELGGEQWGTFATRGPDVVKATSIWDASSYASHGRFHHARFGSEGRFTLSDPLDTDSAYGNIRLVDENLVAVTSGLVGFLRPESTGLTITQTPVNPNLWLDPGRAASHDDALHFATGYSGVERVAVPERPAVASSASFIGKRSFQQPPSPSAGMATGQSASWEVMDDLAGYRSSATIDHSRAFTWDFAEPRIVDIDREAVRQTGDAWEMDTPDGGLRISRGAALEIRSPEGADFRVEESPNLTTWSETHTVHGGTEPTLIPVDLTGDNSSRFFRLREKTP